MVNKYNRKRSISAFIQVRMASKRLPGKALCDINGMTAIERVVNNIKPSKYINKIVIVTARGRDNDPIIDVAKRKGIDYFRGDEINVVERYIEAAKKFNTDIVVRITGDCPLVSFEITDYLIERHLKSGVDYTGIEINSVPIGTFSEVINFSALQKLTGLNVDLSYGEYMSFYFRNNPEYFSIKILPGPKKFYRPNYRLTLDYPQDLEVIRELYECLGKKCAAIPLKQAIAYLDKHPDICIKNKDVKIKWKDDKEVLAKITKSTKIKSLLK